MRSKQKLTPNVYRDELSRSQRLQCNNYVTLFKVVCWPILGRVFFVTCRDVELSTRFDVIIRQVETKVVSRNNKHLGVRLVDPLLACCAGTADFNRRFIPFLRMITNVQTVLTATERCDYSGTIMPCPNTGTVRGNETTVNYSKRARLGVVVSASGTNTIIIIGIVHNGGTIVVGRNASWSVRHKV